MWYELSETGRQILLRTDALELAWSRESGALVALRRPGCASVLGYGSPAPGLDLALDRADGWVGGRAFARYLWHRAAPRDGGVEVTVAVGLGPITVLDRYCVAGSLIVRRALVQNAGTEELRLCGLRLALPGACVGSPERCRFDAPGNSVRPRVALAVAAAQRREVLPRRFFAPGLRGGSALEPAPTQSAGLLALHSDDPPETLLCWYEGTVEAALPFLQGYDGEPNAVILAHEVGLAGWLRPDGEIESGPQLIVLLGRPWPEALDDYRALARIVGRPAFDGAGWPADAAIYATHAGHHGGLAGLTADLPRLADLGVNTIALMPVCCVGADPHSIADLERIDPQLGDAAALRALVDQAHAGGMRVLLDLPLQGAAGDSRYLAEHPDWLLRDEAGSFIIGQPPGVPAVSAHPGVSAPPGRYHLDWQHPALQEHVLGWARAALLDFGVDGLRLVAPYSPALPWGRRGGPHASQSSLAPFELLRRLREEMRRVRPDAALICTLPGPLYAAESDGCYDYLVHHMFVHLALSRITPAELGIYLDDLRRMSGPGCARICFVEAHDTCDINPLADGLRGSRISRMLLAGMVMCGFAPALWSGQERGEEPFLRAVLGLWRSETALRHGTTSYLAVEAEAPSVFAVLREHDGRRLLGLLNVGAHRHTLTVRLPDLGPQVAPRDLLGAAPLGLAAAPDGTRATLEPFAAYCLEL